MHTPIIAARLSFVTVVAGLLAACGATNGSQGDSGLTPMDGGTTNGRGLDRCR